MAKYTREILTRAVVESHSFADVLRHLGLRLSGGTHAHISRRIKEFGIDTSHFTGKSHGYGRGGTLVPPEELLVEMPPGSRRMPGQRLLRALVAIGRLHLCQECGLGPSWNGRALTLHIDHVNGDFLDNRPDNLRVLCPNCHSQTPTFAGRSRSRGSRTWQRPRADASRAAPTEAQAIELLTKVDQGELTAAEAARQLGVAYSTIGRAMKRWKLTGSPLPASAGPNEVNQAILSYSSRHPADGSHRIAAGLAETSQRRIADSTIEAVLARAGLGSKLARLERAAAREQAVG